MISKISNNNTNAKHIAFTSEFYLAKSSSHILEPYSDESLRNNFNQLIPAEKMDKFVSQINLLKEALVNDGANDRIISVQSRKNIIQFISSIKGRSMYEAVGFILDTDSNTINNLAEKALAKVKTL